MGKESGGTTNRLQEQLGYAYDAAGNLNYRTNNSLIQSFNVNSLNELMTATRSGTLTVAGTTTMPATNVTVNTSNAFLYLDRTFASTNHTLANGTNSFTAIAKDTLGRIDTNAITVYLPATNTLGYDLNGNLTNDGVKSFEFDDENQLVRMTKTSEWKAEFVYDGKMRRRIERNYEWRSSAWVKTSETRFVYDGNLPVQERDENNLPKVTLTRGKDLSGSLEGAGGIGGLLAFSQHSTVSPQHAYYHSDGNGNVTMLVDANQHIAAKYIYDPFGRTLSKSSLLADVNRYQFSSKPMNLPSGMYDYLYRWYAPEIQRWLNRDPIGEAGGINLYGYVGNDPQNSIDVDGRSPVLVAIVARLLWDAACGAWALSKANSYHPPNDSNEYKRHCYVGCLTSKCSILSPETIGAQMLHEISRAISQNGINPANWPWREMINDTLATLDGMGHGLKFIFGDCAKDCDRPCRNSR